MSLEKDYFKNGKKKKKRRKKKHANSDNVNLNGLILLIVHTV